MLPTIIQESNFDDFLNSFDNVLTDCDGVLWNSNTVIPGANAALNKLRSLGKKIFYVTNNSTKTRETLVNKCHNLGFVADKEEAISSSFIAAQYLKNKNFQKKVYIVGSDGIGNELDLVGIQHIGVGPMEFSGSGTLEDLATLTSKVKLDPEVGAVIVGFDLYFNYLKILHAASYLKDPGCLFIGTNQDEQFTSLIKDLVFPGTGTFVKAVETASVRKAEIMGKPSARMFTVIAEKHGLDPNRTLMIGDRCNTDILFGKNCGLKTLLVATGINSWLDLVNWSESLNPDDHKLIPNYYLESLGDLEKLFH